MKNNSNIFQLLQKKYYLTEIYILTQFYFLFAGNNLLEHASKDEPPKKRRRYNTHYQVLNYSTFLWENEKLSFSNLVPLYVAL